MYDIVVVVVIIIIIIIIIIVVVVVNGSGFIYRPLAAETLVRSQTGQRGICGGKVALR